MQDNSTLNSPSHTQRLIHLNINTKQSTQTTQQTHTPPRTLTPPHIDTQQEHLMRSIQYPLPTRPLTPTHTHAVTTGKPISNPSTHSSTSQHGETRLNSPPHHTLPIRGHPTPPPVQPPPPCPLLQTTPLHPSPNNRTHNINTLQLNIDSIRYKIVKLTHFMHTNSMHIALLQETK